MVVSLHLFWEELLQPFIFFYLVLNETDGIASVYLHRLFPFLPIVEPCFRPPAYSGKVGIYGHKSWYIKTLYVYLQFGQRVDDTAARYCLGVKFFFTSSSKVDR